MDKLKELARTGWAKYRSWPLWGQIVGGIVALSIVVGPFTDDKKDKSDNEETQVVSDTTPTTSPSAVALTTSPTAPPTQVATTTETTTTTTSPTTTVLAPTTTTPVTAAPLAVRSTTVPKTSPPTTQAPQAPIPFAGTPGAGTPGGCSPHYSPCVPIDSDVDCAGGSGNGPSYVQGPVTVIGSDVYGLDRDGNGIGCD
jgi:hypothetical protein